MAGGKLSPRQKMINMMYLVLTALLALNVSAEILKAFSMINASLETTYTTLSDKNASLYKQFQKKMDDEPGKTKPFYDKAMIAKAETEKLMAMVKSIKDKLTDEAGLLDGKVDEKDYKIEGDHKVMINDGNIDIPSRVLVQEGNSKLGLDLQNAINTYRDKMLTLLDEKDKPSFKMPIDAAKDGKKKWLVSTFNGLPVIGAYTLLTKYENDLKNTEAEIVKLLLGDIDKNDFKFDQLVAKVIAPSSYILVGQEYTADVLLVAYDSRQNPNIKVGGSPLKVEAGMGKYSTRASAEGVKKWGGVIEVKAPDGSTKEYPFEAEYQVAKPAAVVSPDKMNVFYVGVDNPVSISVPGVPLDKVRPSISGGTITGSNGKYVVRQEKPGKVTVTVNAEVSGKQMNMGASEFRVKYVPNPTATVGGVDPGSVSSANFKAQAGLIAVLKDFDFDLKFKVTKFRMIYLPPRRDPIVRQITGPAFSGDASGFVTGAKPGDKFIFDEIEARGPDNTPRKLAPIIYNIN